ncbi:telomere length regulation protein TEL2 homolog isoform X1 [Adelges cooleyi]|uniref:telomere length regulation protein TEL2 homolog isoform X1 n=1 Tax=Adelges cooleyi TaxID=133065 RepID=UPI0021807A03|nr:telomere length regulation protein TEL2 homolog isoform X1 [Adelges cooleyi]
MWKVRELADKVTNVVLNYTEIEAKVREATNDEAWGPTGNLMQEVAQATFMFEHFPEVMGMLWKRMLHENKKNWRRTYKSLLLLNYLVKNGSERVVTSAREHIYDLRGLENYSYVDEFGKDQGINIRHKVKELIDFIQDDDKLREERKKAKKNKDKYIGLSSEAMGYKGTGIEKWDDVPRWKKSSSNEFSDKKNSNTLGFEESPNNSDENDVVDSEPELDIPQKPVEIFKDRSVSPTKVQSPAKHRTPVKRIDLGAAAHYGKQQSVISNPTTTTNNLLDTETSSVDLLNIVDDSNKQSNDFGDFNAVFSTAPNTKNSEIINQSVGGDEFADFSSAFTQSMSLSSNPVSSVQTPNQKLITNTDLLTSLPQSSNNKPSSNLLDLNFDALENTALKITLKKLIESIHKHSDLDIKMRLKEFIEYMPGPMTPQKITKLDSADYSQITKIYGQILEIVLQLTDFTKYFQIIKPIFAPDGGNLEMLDLSLHILWNYIARNPLSFKTDCAIDLIDAIFKSDLIKSSLILETLNANNNRFTSVLEFLLSLPSRIANKVEQNLPKQFSPIEFSNGLVQHILFVIDQLCKYYTLEKVKLNIKPISAILFKTVAYFPQNNFSTAIKILECWCMDDNYAIIIRNALIEADRRAIDRLGLLLCCNLSTPRSLYTLLGDSVIDIPNWNYTLCKKLLFLFYNEDNNIVINLMNYLKLVQIHSNKNILCNIVLELVEVWSNRSAMLHTPIEQHYYLSKLIVFGAYCLSDMALNNDFITNFEIKLFEGVPIHLESSEEKMRTIGMIVAETVIGFIKDKDNLNQLNFEYDSLQEESKLIAKTLKEFPNNNFKNKLKFDTAFDLLQNFCLANSNVVNPKRTVLSKPDLKEASERVKNKILEEEQLDSDDDLEPYDLSNDIKTNIKNQPKYLRDLIDGFNEQKDADIWIGSLEVAENLIKTQLPNDDITFAIELLTLLISMEKQFYLENFESLRYHSAVAVVKIFPFECAKHLCSMFYASIGKYAVCHRILMLNILTGSAKELSGFEKITDDNTNDGLAVKVNVNDLECIVKQRIKQKTRIISTPKAPIKLQSNHFALVANAFFFPLIRGNLTDPIIHQHTDDMKDLNFLGVHLLNSLSVILCCAVNSMHVVRMGMELLEWTWSLRFHNDVKIRTAVMGCVAAVLLSVPKSRLIDDMSTSLLEFVMWLENVVVSEGVMNKIDNEVDSEARKFAVQVLILYKNTFGDGMFIK